MFLFSRPSPKRIQTFLEQQRGALLSYAEEGESRHGRPEGYLINHRRARLGTGPADFEVAKSAISNWKMFPVGSVEVVSPETSIVAGTDVAVLAGRFGLWTLNACRIVYCIDEQGCSDEEPPVSRFGFAYGTLPAHLERGEERFSVEWHQADDSVWYDLYSFSRPNGWLTRMIQPFVKRAQQQFIQDSLDSMQQFVSTYKSQ